MRPFGILIAATCFFVGSVLLCKAEMPTCTGDRHYDGVACCPVVDPPSDPTTTTTLPDTASCPPVTCVCNDVDKPTTVIVQRALPYYYHACRHTKGKHGHLVCPNIYHPRLVLVPSGRP
jgi:hypothetical protein